jgi:hypothetical protein
MPNALGSIVGGLLLLVVLVVPGGCGGDDDEQGADARSSGQAQLAGTPLFGDSVQPGQRYRTRRFQPALSFVVQDGDWLAGETQSRTLVVLDDSNLPHRPMFLAFQRYRRVYEQIGARTGQHRARSARLHCLAAQASRPRNGASLHRPA